MTTYNTRVAPSPSGDMHVGTARTAYFNWLLAKATGGKFLLRIDDTNEKKIDERHVADITETMKWLGLDPHATVRQSERFDRYKEVADQLLRDKIAGQAVGDAAVRLLHVKLPDHWRDEIAGDIPVTKEDRAATDQMVLLRSDGTPTYHFASVVDDIDFGVNFILRGTDHISNTARQIALFNAVRPSNALPKFAHVGLIHFGGKKLSKRDGAAGVLHYRGKGYDPDAFLNFLLRMGWGPRTDDKTTAVISRERAINLFVDGGNLRSSPSNMDLAKLEAYDRKYKARKGVFRTGTTLMETSS